MKIRLHQHGPADERQARDDANQHLYPGFAPDRWRFGEHSHSREDDREHGNDQDGRSAKVAGRRNHPGASKESPDKCRNDSEDLHDEVMDLVFQVAAGFGWACFGVHDVSFPLARVLGCCPKFPVAPCPLKLPAGRACLRLRSPMSSIISGLWLYALQATT
jgi:hypothetical protein